MGVSKSFGTNITENHLDNLSALFFGQALDQMGQKCRYLAENASFYINDKVIKYIFHRIKYQVPGGTHIVKSRA